MKSKNKKIGKSPYDAGYRRISIPKKPSILIRKRSASPYDASVHSLIKEKKR